MFLGYADIMLTIDEITSDLFLGQLMRLWDSHKNFQIYLQYYTNYIKSRKRKYYFKATRLYTIHIVYRTCVPLYYYHFVWIKL
jgi:hypothetical protein